MSERSEPRWRRRKEARAKEILDAALDLFAERGFAATRLEDIAQKAGVSKGTLYLYFENKEDIFRSMVRETLVSNITIAEKLIPLFPGSTIFIFDRIIDAVFGRIVHSRAAAIPKIIIGEAHNFPELVRFYVEEVVERVIQMVSLLLERGIERGEFRPVTVEDVAPALMGPLLMLSLWKTAIGPVSSHQIDLDKALAAHKDNVRRILLAPKGNSK